MNKENVKCINKYIVDNNRFDLLSEFSSLQLTHKKGLLKTSVPYTHMNSLHRLMVSELYDKITGGE